MEKRFQISFCALSGSKVATANSVSNLNGLKSAEETVFFLSIYVVETPLDANLRAPVEEAVAGEAVVGLGAMKASEVEVKRTMTANAEIFMLELVGLLLLLVCCLSFVKTGYLEIVRRSKLFSALVSCPGRPTAAFGFASAYGEMTIVHPQAFVFSLPVGFS